MGEQETRAKILKAGEELFSLKGYDATSIQEICEKAEVSKGAFFHYFPTKERFFLEILDLWLKDLTSRINEYIETSQNVYESLLKMTELFREIFRESRPKFLLFIEFLRAGIRDENILKKLSEYFELYTNYFSQIISEGIEKGILKKVDTRVTAHVIVSYAIGTIEQQIFKEDNHEFEEISKEGIRLILESIKKEE
ncbi:MAG: TetR/AcrR family transcriptional regulator [bacterium]|nr:TetR/AcrR family transcriptional regulator [bacterium]